MSDVLSQMRRDGIEPAPELRQLLTQPPMPQDLWPGCRAWMITRHEDVRTVLSDHSRFSNDVLFGDPMEPSAGYLMRYDPPAHGRLRGVLTAEFTMRRIARLRPRVEAIVAEHLDAMAGSGTSADLVEAFSLPIPSLVICELLGVPSEGREDFQRHSARMINFSSAADDLTQSYAELYEYMASLVEFRRRKPADDLLSSIIQRGDLNDDEIAGLGGLLLIAGHETTASMLSLGVLLLLCHPDQLARVRDEDEIVEPAVEEMLRYLSIANPTRPRRALQDVELSGRLIREGELVTCSFLTANHDEVLGGDLDRFDVSRKPVTHVAFGHGAHHCVGAPLARLELAITIPMLLRRFPSLRLAVPFEEIPFRATSFVHGVTRLPVTWGA